MSTFNKHIGFQDDLALIWYFGSFKPVIESINLAADCSFLLFLPTFPIDISRELGLHIKDPKCDDIFLLSIVFSGIFYIPEFHSINLLSSLILQSPTFVLEYHKENHNVHNFEFCRCLNTMISIIKIVNGLV